MRQPTVMATVSNTHLSSEFAARVHLRRLSQTSRLSRAGAACRSRAYPFRAHGNLRASKWSIDGGLASAKGTATLQYQGDALRRTFRDGVLSDGWRHRGNSALSEGKIYSGFGVVVNKAAIFHPSLVRTHNMLTRNGKRSGLSFAPITRSSVRCR